MIEKLNILSENEREILFSLSVLPPETYSFPEICSFFLIEEYEQAGFFDTVHDLSTKGFLIRTNSFYAIKPAVAEEIISRYHPGIEQTAKIINYFSAKLEQRKMDFEKGFLPIFHQLSFLFEKIDNHSLHLAQLSYLLSSNLIKYKRFDEALQYNQLAVDITQQIDNKHPLVALFYRDKAYIHKKMGDTGKAIYYSLKDIEILERFEGKYDDLLPDSYFALSKTYEGIRNYEKAVEYNLKAIKFEKKRNNNKSVKLSSLYHNLAYYYLKLNNLHHASMFINKAVESFSSEKLKAKSQYFQLIKDQKRFNYMYEIEQLIKKYRIPIIAFFGIILSLLVWIIFKLII